LYGVFRSSNMIGVFDGLSYIDLYTPNHAYNTLVIRSNGLILASNISTNAKLLSEYMRTSTTHLVGNEFLNHKMDVVWTQMHQETYAMAYAPLTDTVPLYYLTFFEKSTLVQNFGNIHLYFIAALFVVGVVFIISNFAIFYITHTKFSEIENSRLKVYYNKRIMLRITKTGRIKGFNLSFKTLVPEYKKYKHVNDFILDDTSFETTLVERIKKLYAFNIRLETGEDDLYIRLTPVKMGLSYVLIGENMTEEDTNLRAYESLALVSRVTNLPNYNYFMQFLNEQIKSEAFLNDKFTIIGINLLDFKNINKLIGETLANEVLKGFSKIILKSLTDVQHILFNTYIDNFFVVFKNSKNVEEVETWFEELLSNVEAQSELLGSNLHLELRAGIYDVKLIMGEQITAKQIYNRIMTALRYANTSSTLKCVRYDVTLRNLVSHQKKIERGLIESIEKNEFEIFLQPQLDIKRNKIVSFESLIRWSNPNFANIKPSEFIKLAEESNLIVKIGMIAMEETMKMAKALEAYDITIAMNVSPIQMIQKGFVSIVEEFINKYKIKPGTIAIEITETSMINSLQIMSEKLKSLQRSGIDIHLDDFGMGYSSLLYLKDLPINMIKIDKSFIDHITTDKYSKAIANMVVTLSKHIGVGVIAEGVETKAQVDQLRKIGVNIIQGYYISKAVPYQDALALLKKYNNE
ncbi:MAG TPA: EAL domain-containing protein, partial [Acholeplasmataceae bacterium]|nr:EAL domain-containing protein [Acholeplasmataceae bacterium]